MHITVSTINNGNRKHNQLDRNWNNEVTKAYGHFPCQLKLSSIDVYRTKQKISVFLTLFVLFLFFSERIKR